MESDGIIDPMLHFHERSSEIIDLGVVSIACQLTSLRTMVNI